MNNHLKQIKSIKKVKLIKPCGKTMQLCLGLSFVGHFLHQVELVKLCLVSSTNSYFHPHQANYAKDKETSYPHNSSQKQCFSWGQRISVKIKTLVHQISKKLKPNCLYNAFQLGSQSIEG